MKKVFLEISQNSYGNTCTRDAFLIKLQAYRVSGTGVPVDFVKFLRTPIFTEQFRWLLLTIQFSISSYFYFQQKRASNMLFLLIDEIIYLTL